MSTAEAKEFVAPPARVGDDVIVWSSWPKRNGQDYVGKVVRVAPQGHLTVWFVTAQGPRMAESIPHIDDPMLEEMPERWSLGGWSLAPTSQRIFELERQIQVLRDDLAIELDVLAEAIRDIASQKIQKAQEALANRQASIKRAQKARSDHRAAAKNATVAVNDSAEEGLPS